MLERHIRLYIPERMSLKELQHSLKDEEILETRICARIPNFKIGKDVKGYTVEITEYDVNKDEKVHEKSPHKIIANPSVNILSLSGPAACSSFYRHNQSTEKGIKYHFGDEYRLFRSTMTESMPDQENGVRGGLVVCIREHALQKVNDVFWNNPNEKLGMSIETPLRLHS